MNIGKQSTLNDLGDLKKDLESKIAAAAAIKVGEVSQIESGTITGGTNVVASRPTGVYRLTAEATGHGVYGSYEPKTGMILQMTHPDYPINFGQIFLKWDASVAALTEIDGVQKVSNFWSTANTITDSNGFLKAA